MLEVTDSVKADVKSIKPFLLQLYRAETRHIKTKVLNQATNFELSTLIKILHFIANKEIKFAKSRIEELKKTRRLPYILQHFKTDESVKLLLSSTRSHQLDILKKIGLFIHILHSMFSEF